MTFKPLANKIVLKKIENDTTKSGIVLTKKEENSVSLVIAVADNIDCVKVGDYVIQARFAGSDITDGDENLTILDIRDVLAIIEDGVDNV